MFNNIENVDDNKNKDDIALNIISMFFNSKKLEDKKNYINIMEKYYKENYE
jgi:hypothetical protein